MFANLSVHALGLHADLSTSADLARRHGFDGIDLPLDEVAVMDAPRRARNRLDEAGLRWGGFGLPVDFRDEEAAFETDLARLRDWAPVAAQVGCTRCVTWIFPGHDALGFAENFQRHERRLGDVAAALAPHGVRLGLEFVGPRTLRETVRHPFIHTMDGMLELADAVARRAGVDPAMVGLLLDAFHWWTSGDAETDILEATSADRIVYVHVNDGHADRTRDEQLDGQRALPCETGLIDAGRFMRCLGAMGYDGPVTAEPFLAELAEGTADAAVDRTTRAMRRLFAAAEA